MVKSKQVEDAQPDWLSRCWDAGTAGRFYANDERSPASQEFSPSGHFARLVLASGLRAWSYVEGGPHHGSEILLSEVKSMVDRGELDRCLTYKKVWFHVEGIGHGCGLWIFWRGPKDWTMRNHVQILTPRYPLIAELRADEIKQRDLARSARDPKTPPKAMKTRGDII